MPAVTIRSNQAGKDFLEANKDSFVVLFFNAEFTDQSDIVEKGIAALSEATDLKDKISVGLVDVESTQELGEKFVVLSVPIVVCVAEGKELKKIDILEPTKLVKSVTEELNRYKILAGDSSDAQTDSKQSFKEYLKRLTNRAPVMVFMKGDPSQPRCGFSRQLVELLTRNEVKYESFDILQDEDVRQGLKEYSDWPTYPQIYAKGEFVGGLDILKQMEETGELKSSLHVV